MRFFPVSLAKIYDSRRKECFNFGGEIEENFPTWSKEKRREWASRLRGTKKLNLFLIFIDRLRSKKQKENTFFPSHPPTSHKKYDVIVGVPLRQPKALHWNFPSLSRLSRHEIVKYFDARAKSNIEKCSKKEKADEKCSSKRRKSHSGVWIMMMCPLSGTCNLSSDSRVVDDKFISQTFAQNSRNSHTTFDRTSSQVLRRNFRLYEWINIVCGTGNIVESRRECFEILTSTCHIPWILNKLHHHCYSFGSIQFSLQREKFNIQM